LKNVSLKGGPAPLIKINGGCPEGGKKKEGPDVGGSGTFGKVALSHGKGRGGLLAADLFHKGTITLWGEHSLWGWKVFSLQGGGFNVGCFLCCGGEGIRSPREGVSSEVKSISF